MGGTPRVEGQGGGRPAGCRADPKMGMVQPASTFFQLASFHLPQKFRNSEPLKFSEIPWPLIRTEGNLRIYFIYFISFLQKHGWCSNSNTAIRDFQPLLEPYATLVSSPSQGNSSGVLCQMFTVHSWTMSSNFLGSVFPGKEFCGIIMVSCGLGS